MNKLDKKVNDMQWVPRQHGVGLIKALMFVPIALVTLLVFVFAFYEARKTYWDYRVQEMCEKDGGLWLLRKY